MIVPPLDTMRLRRAQLATELGASFGKVRNWDTQRRAYSKTHQGWDLEAPVGTRCRAIADGLIEHVIPPNDYGWQVVLRFSKSGNQLQSVPGDTLFAHYAHLSKVLVRAGQSVTAGQTIAHTGVSGNASAGAPHLHFEIRTTNNPRPGLGKVGRLDPGEVLGYQYYNCANA